VTVKRARKADPQATASQDEELNLKIRTDIEPFPISKNGSLSVALRDSLSLAPSSLLLPFDMFYILQFFDGRYSGLEIRAEYLRKFGDFLFEKPLLELLQKLDEYYLLDNERSRNRLAEMKQAYLQQSYREPCCAGKSYPAHAKELARQLDAYAECDGADQNIMANLEGKTVKGFIAPHIDVRLGGPTYAQAYKILANSTPADLYVIFGTAHHGAGNLFALTKKDYQTPFGPAVTEGVLVDEICRQSDVDFLSDELQHRTEHSVEFQTIFLKHFIKSKFKILPVLCSFQPSIYSNKKAAERQKLETFLQALKTALKDYAGSICYVASVDFAHVGPRYGDRFTPTPSFMAQVERSDREVLQSLTSSDREAFQETIREKGNRFRICGYSPLVTLLAMMPPAQGTLLAYSSSKMDDNKSMVTFASMIYQ
jgi:AmmeMemoRadiSam system protein B